MKAKEGRVCRKVIKMKSSYHLSLRKREQKGEQASKKKPLKHPKLKM